MEVKNLDQAVRDILANKRESLSEEYRTKLDEYIDRTTNPNHLIKLLNEEDLEKALDERETKREANLKYQQNKKDEENTYPNLFKKNFDVELKDATFDDLEVIKGFLTTKITQIDELLSKKKLSRISALEEELKRLKAL
jgi:hypothetical protein